jgi:hypothetical protein
MSCEVSVVVTVLENAEGLLDLAASVLPQLSAEDELIIVVEPRSPGVPSDMTREVAGEIARQSPSVRVLVREGATAHAGCAQGILAARGAYIFFAEPGDLWAPDKISCVREAFAASDVALILHDAELLDTSRRLLAPSLFAVRESQQGARESLLHNSYVGSCLAFRKPLQEYFLPFPPEALRYEQWIGCVAERFGGVALINKPLIGKMMVGRGASVLTTMSMRERRQEQSGMRKALQQREKELSRGSINRSI